MTNYANRGRNLERAIKKVFESYESRGIYCQQNFPEQLSDGTRIKRHGFDFQVLYQNKFYAFDAKECSFPAWPLDKAKPHQVKALLDVYNNGGEAFFLVYFTQSKELVKFDIKKVQTSIIGGVKKLLPSDGEKTTINILGVA